MKKLRFLFWGLLSLGVLNSCVPNDEDAKPYPTSKGNAVFGFSKVAETVAETVTTLSVPIVVAEGTAPAEWPITFDITFTVAEGGSKDDVTITKAKGLTITEANNTVMELTLALDNVLIEGDRVYTFTIENIGGEGVTLDDTKKSFVLTVIDDDAMPPASSISANSIIVKPSGGVLVPINNVNIFWGKGGDGAIATDMGTEWEEPNLEAPAIEANLIKDANYEVAVIWTDIPEGINVTFAKKATYFTVTGIPATAGNIVVGVKKVGAEDYLWSWHLWVTDFNPDTGAVILPNGRLAMDRDLGATNATPGDLGSLGLYYQWGRKDPFPGASAITVGTGTVRTTYPAAMPDAVEGGVGTLLSVVGKPNVFYDCYPEMGKTDVINTGHLFGRKGYNRWGGTIGHTDKTEAKNAKSIYDPCPEGWRMPWGANWSGFTYGYNGETNLELHTDGWDNKPGRTYTNEGKTIWFPAAGNLDNLDGIPLAFVSVWSFYWSGTPNSMNDGYYLYFKDTVVTPSNHFHYRSNGFTVRPVKDPDYVPAQ